jgi:hypothetical protein
MRTGSADTAATTLMCFCEQVAPQFLYKTYSDQNYYPENILVGTGVNDTDKVGQTMDHGAEQPTQADDHYPQYENAFGLAQQPREEARDAEYGARVWRAGGGSGTTPYDTVSEDFDYYALLATLVQTAGPGLTPAAGEAGLMKMGPITPGNNADEHTPQRSISPGDYTWNDVMREVYWSPTKKSPFNGAPGTWVSMNGGRWFRTGEFPAALIGLPPKPR